MTIVDAAAALVAFAEVGADMLETNAPVAVATAAAKTDEADDYEGVKVGGCIGLTFTGYADVIGNDATGGCNWPSSIIPCYCCCLKR